MTIRRERRLTSRGTFRTNCLQESQFQGRIPVDQAEPLTITATRPSLHLTLPTLA